MPIAILAPLPKPSRRFVNIYGYFFSTGWASADELSTLMPSVVYAPVYRMPRLHECAPAHAKCDDAVAIREMANIDARRSSVEISV